MGVDSHFKGLFTRVTLPLAVFGLINQAARTVMAIIGPVLAVEFRLSASELGLLAACMLGAYAAAQLPGGMALDRVGARNVQAGLGLVTAVGFALFALAEDFATLAVARVIVGVGVSAGLMAIIKANAQWFAPAKVALVTGIAVSIGGMGSVLATAPVAAALPTLGWRGVLWVLCALSAATALWIYVCVPDKRGGSMGGLRAELGVMASILGSRVFWRFAPAVAMLSVLNFTYLGLWAGPWLRDVAGYDSQASANTLLAYTATMMVGALLVGAAASRAKARGYPPMLVTLVCTAGQIGAQIGLALQPAAPLVVGGLWMLFAFCVAGAAAGYVTVRQMPEQTARVATARCCCSFSSAPGFSEQDAYPEGIMLCSGPPELPMDNFELTIRNGTVATATETTRCDVGISGEKIVAVAEHLPAGRRDIDASDCYVLPGGIDSHCHIEQLSGMGIMSADDFYSGTVSAAFGGTTTIIPFAAQHRGTSVTTTVADYHERARSKAVIDYGFHLIIGDPTEKVLNEELPAAIRGGITSFKVYMTYPKWRLEDYQLLEVLSVAGREGALVMVHAENDDMIRWIAKRLIERGHGAPKFHGVAHSPLAEAEATHRIIMLSRVLGAPVLIVHVSSPEATNTIRAAQTLGARIYAETCPQYLVLTAEDMDRPGVEGAKWCCSPPLRDKAAQEAIWAGLGNGTFQVYSSDHAPYKFDETAKIPRGEQTTFKEMANGVPGIEMRLPILFSEGVLKKRLTINQFVALGATNHARMYGLYPRKGTITIGSDADIAVWDPEVEKRIEYSMMHDAVGYTPYEGHVYKGWPQIVLSRGRVVVEGSELKVARGSGRYLARGVPGPAAVAATIDGPARKLRQLIG